MRIACARTLGTVVRRWVGEDPHAPAGWIGEAMADDVSPPLSVQSAPSIRPSNTSPLPFQDGDETVLEAGGINILFEAEGASHPDDSPSVLYVTDVDSDLEIYLDGAELKKGKRTKVKPGAKLDFGDEASYTVGKKSMWGKKEGEAYLVAVHSADGHGTPCNLRCHSFLPRSCATSPRMPDWMPPRRGCSLFAPLASGHSVHAPNWDGAARGPESTLFFTNSLDTPEPGQMALPLRSAIGMVLHCTAPGLSSLCNLAMQRDMQSQASTHRAAQTGTHQALTWAAAAAWVREARLTGMPGPMVEESVAART